MVSDTFATDSFSLLLMPETYLHATYEMHDEQLGWEEIQAEYDALSEREKQRYSINVSASQLGSLRASAGLWRRQMWTPQSSP